MTLWVVRAGDEGQQEEDVIRNNVASIHWNEFDDLSHIHDLSTLKTLYRERHPYDGKKRVETQTAQIWSFIHDIKKGDLVAIPRLNPTNPFDVQIGEIAGDYEYREYYSQTKHTRKIKWLRTIQRSELSDDVKSSLGASRTVYQVRATNAENKIRSLLKITGPNESSKFFLVSLSNFGSPHVLQKGFYQHLGWQHQPLAKARGDVRVGDFLVVYFAGRSIGFKSTLKRIYKVKSATKNNQRFYLSLWKNLNGISFENVKALIREGKLDSKSFNKIGLRWNISKLTRVDFDTVLKLDSMSNTGIANVVKSVPSDSNKSPNKNSARPPKRKSDYIQKIKDEMEQEELDEKIEDSFSNNAVDGDELVRRLNELNNLNQSKKVVSFQGKKYKRNNYVISLLKKYRGFKCQLCQKKILKDDGTFYVEGAHITDKKDGGSETPSNILILCPNHHKEFDLGKVELKYPRRKEMVDFEMNKTWYHVDLSIK